MTTGSYTASSAKLSEILQTYLTAITPTAILITGPPGSGKTTLLKNTLDSHDLETQPLSPEDLVRSPETAITTAFHASPNTKAVTLDNIDLYCPPNPSTHERRVITCLSYHLSHTPCIFLGTTTTTTAVHPALLHRLQHVITIDALSYHERLSAVSHMFTAADAEMVAEATPGFLWGDLTRLLKRLSAVEDEQRIHALPGLLEQVRPSLLVGQEVVPTQHKLHGMNSATNQLQQILHAVFPQSNKLTNARRALNEIGTFRGVLIHGPTGTGKTTLARKGKELVRPHTVNFLELLSTEVVGCVVGEGERRLKRVFEIARAIAPCVVIIDNIDIIAPVRRDDSGSGGKAFERVLSTLLVLIDGVVKDERPVLVVGITRNLSLVDGALLRPGRFDLHIRVHPPDQEARVRIMEDFLSVRSLKKEDVGIDSSFGVLSEGWNAPEVLSFIKKRILRSRNLTI